jgi:hypothetical protein
VIEELPGAGTAVWFTVTTPAEATVAERAGADALVGRRCSQRAPAAFGTAFPIPRFIT